METAKLKKFAQFARRSLLEQVGGRLMLVLADDSAARRESAEVVKKLEQRIKEQGQESFFERVAYIWFNRFCALRFMDVNGYTTTRIVSPAEGQFQPEILAEAKMGHIDEELVPLPKTRQQIVDLLNGTAASRDPQGEAYRLLLVAACNYWHRAMPFLFERIDDYTELLLPDDLLSGNSILAYAREAMTPDVCEDVEVIGWLYQYYISEKKDEVFEGLKKNKKVTPENIPAATQLFTPHWIVRYLVENSLGRLWMLHRPGSKLVERMEYYIAPEEGAGTAGKMPAPLSFSPVVEFRDSGAGILPACSARGAGSSDEEAESVLESPQQFQPLVFDETIDVTERRLPHWEQEGATYFVTFRLADSIPQEKQLQWRAERDEWLAEHPEPLDERGIAEYKRLFSDRRQQWLDNGYGSCVLRDPQVTAIVSSALRFFDMERYVLDAFIVMPNHVHVLIKPLSGNSLSSILHSWKSFTAKQINKITNHTGAVWQDESFDHIVRSLEHLDFYRTYIKENPVKAGLPAIQSERGAGILPACLSEESGGGLEKAGRMPAPQSFTVNVGGGERGAGILPACSHEGSGGGAATAGKMPAPLSISSPEEIKVCDPACGSGHMLVYAFELLYAIYEEEGYDPSDIPGKILTYNLYGIEIDERAGELAAFALVMQARKKNRRFLRKPVQPNICVLQNIQFEKNELNNYMAYVGRALFTPPLQATLHQFEEADNFGSLIRPEETEVTELVNILEAKDSKEITSHYLNSTHEKTLGLLKQVGYLSPKYHVVIANPPYMGGKGMNGRLGAWLKEHYPDTKSDLFAAFIERNLHLVREKGVVAMITMQSWMFLSTFEKLRSNILGHHTILGMAHLGARAFDSIGGEVVSTTAFVLENANHANYKGDYLRLVDGNSEAEKDAALREAIKNPNCGWFFRASAADFKKIPGSPVAYWVSENVRNSFSQLPKFEDLAPTRKGMVTARNEIYVRDWQETSLITAGLDKFRDRDSASKSGKKWFSYTKGGGYRKWFGNRCDVVNWEHDGKLLQTFKHPTEDRVWATNFNLEYIFSPNVNWGAVTSASFSARISEGGELFDAGGSACFPKDIGKETVLGFLNAKVSSSMLRALNPTLNFQAGNIANLPLLCSVDCTSTIGIVEKLIFTHRLDWDSYETSWDFTNLPLLQPDYRQSSLNATYQNLRAHWQEMTLEMQRLEEENNSIFIEAYNLQSELTPEVPLNEITLTCNPHYRYDHTKPEAELEALLLADTLKEYISYAVGCMFGRYSLNKPGLILASQGETMEDYLRKIQGGDSGAGILPAIPSAATSTTAGKMPAPLFSPDPDNVIPILDGEWFIDDITDRFRHFLRVTFGDDHYEENLKFIEAALGKDIRKYFLKDFYNDHIKRYKKRPIYWLFSSPKGSFNALIYMHRYRPDTVSVVLNDYLREFRAKLEARREHLKRVEVSADAAQSEKTKAVKEVAKLTTMIEELNDYERQVLYPLAIQQIPIDLDDGVKVNYLKFGSALKKIPGLEAKEED